ncbi:MAG: hypothetical protein JW862_10480 [Anaerolineales bacterium]|nr:hypothetical protein [Anaerolineales bacterium]
MVSKGILRPFVRSPLSWLLVLLAFVLVIGTACSLFYDIMATMGLRFSKEADTQQVPPPPVKAWITSENTDAQAGVPRKVYIGGQVNNNATTVTVEWSPPIWSSNFTFHTQQPENPNGPAPYVFKNVPVGADGLMQTVVVTYVPDLISSQDSVTVSDHAVITANNAQASALGEMTITRSAESPASLISYHSRGNSPASFTTQPDDYYAWHNQVWFGLPNLSWDPVICQEALDVLQSQATFVGLRFPNAWTLDPASGSVGIPLLFQPGNMPYLALLDERSWPANEVFTIPLRLAPEHNDYLYNWLPQKEGESWLALDLSTDVASLCQQSPQLPAGEWEFSVQFWLDFGGLEDACQNCVLETYFCYIGQEDPLGISPVAFRSDATVAGVQAENTTCLGPLPLRLAEQASDPPFMLLDSNILRVEPGQRVTLSHLLLLEGQASQEVEISVSSSSGLDWELFTGTFDEADLDSPIQGALQLSQAISPLPIWLSVEIPAGAQGPETVVLTVQQAGQPESYTWDASLLWIGDWQPPPLPAPPQPTATHTPVPTATTVALAVSPTATVPAAAQLPTATGQSVQPTTAAPAPEDVPPAEGGSNWPCGAGAIPLGLLGVALIWHSRHLSSYKSRTR